jgi:hypothetical protein
LLEAANYPPCNILSEDVYKSTKIGAGRYSAVGNPSNS